MKIALLHYAFAPVVGGVESVILQHARLLAGKGHDVRVIFGDGGMASEAVTLRRIPLVSARHPRVKALQRALEDTCSLPTDFQPLVSDLCSALTPELEDRDVVIAHNLWVMPFHLALTRALWQLADCPANGSQRWINWVHDLAASRPDTTRPDHPDHPARLLFQHHPDVEVVTVSDMRRDQIEANLGVPSGCCTIIPNGIDTTALLPPMQPPLAELASRDRWLQRDLVLLHPTRIVPRKNIEFGIDVAAALRDLEVDLLYLITAARDPHQCDNVYSANLRDRLRARGLDHQVIFLSDTAPVADSDLAGLYAYADALFLPSLEEGFGLPLLEAALARLPVFACDLPPSLDILPNGAHFFSPSDKPSQVARRLLSALSSWPQFNARKSVASRFNWHRILQQHLIPFLCKA